jgi:hypothetical protein
VAVLVPQPDDYLRRYYPAARGAAAITTGTGEERQNGLLHQG